MASMRRVTRKPPKMFTDAIRIPAAAKMVINTELEPIWISAPRMMIDEIAFVTAIKGVCRLWADVPDDLEADKDRQNEDDEMRHEARRRHEADRENEHRHHRQQRDLVPGLRLEGRGLLGPELLGRLLFRPFPVAWPRWPAPWAVAAGR